MASVLETSNEVLLKLQNTFGYDICSENVSNGIIQWQTLESSSHISELDSQYDRRNVIGLSVVLTFVLTYMITFIKSSIRLRSKKYGREPPMAPYWIPFLGNLLSFAWDPFTYCVETTCVPYLPHPTSAGILKQTT